MTPTRRRRLAWVLILVVGVGAAVALGLQAFRQNLMYFYSPTQVLAGEVPAGARFRLGGLVQVGSVQREPNSLKQHFVLADCDHSLPVFYEGILPDLFREGQGIVASGKLNAKGVFVATEVLAKHDAEYMPPAVAESLKSQQTGASCMPTDMSKQAGAKP